MLREARTPRLAQRLQRLPGPALGPPVPLRHHLGVEHRVQGQVAQDLADQGLPLGGHRLLPPVAYLGCSGADGRTQMAGEDRGLLQQADHRTPDPVRLGGTVGDRPMRPAQRLEVLVAATGQMGADRHRARVGDQAAAGPEHVDQRSPGPAVAVGEGMDVLEPGVGHRGLDQGPLRAARVHVVHEVVHQLADGVGGWRDEIRLRRGRVQIAAPRRDPPKTSATPEFRRVYAV